MRHSNGFEFLTISKHVRFAVTFLGGVRCGVRTDNHRSYESQNLVKYSSKRVYPSAHRSLRNSQLQAAFIVLDEGDIVC